MKLDDLDLNKIDLSKLSMEEKVQVYELMRIKDIGPSAICSRSTSLTPNR
jgi:hypothetical protein